MSHRSPRLRHAQEGQTVVVYGGKESLHMVTLAKGLSFDNKHGHFKHEQFIGAPFGSKIYALKPSGSGQKPGWVVLLEVTPNLYPLACSHRTEVLYPADIGYIIHRLNIQPGAVVFEAGTGSGALSVAIAFAIRPSGHLYTFEYHQHRAAAAREDFVRLGLSDVVTVLGRDVVRDGFALDAGVRGDAVFLDVPAPWLAIAAASAVLHSHGLLASFSPCLEQVVKTCEVLHTLHFADIVTVEVLLRNFEVSCVADVVTDNEFTPSQREHYERTSKRTRKRIREHSENANDVGADVQSTAPHPHVTNRLLVRPCPEMRGHTGYLTFARKTGNQ
jgi:tRNA (adenine57-N1/adenine58-N1)-methyltransferase